MRRQIEHVLNFFRRFAVSSEDIPRLAFNLRNAARDRVKIWKDLQGEPGQLGAVGSPLKKRLTQFRF